MEERLPTIAVLGASGLIGQAVAMDLLRNGYPVVPVGRRFTKALQAAFGSAAVESQLAALKAQQLARLLAEQAGRYRRELSRGASGQHAGTHR
jgi:NADP-dependent 3-hydroxy acid dehydrogenase YdfG